MPRLAIAFVLALAANAANAQGTGLHNRARRPLPATMKQSRSCLMHECRAMVSGGERAPTIITPALVPSSCRRKQASPGANGESAHPLIGLVSLPQPRQHLQPAVTVGGQQSHFGLIVLHRLHGVVADAAVGAAGVEAGLGQSRLHLLHFGKCQRALEPGKG